MNAEHQSRATDPFGRQPQSSQPPPSGHPSWGGHLGHPYQGGWPTRGGYPSHDGHRATPGRYPLHDHPSVGGAPPPSWGPTGAGHQPAAYWPGHERGGGSSRVVWIAVGAFVLVTACTGFVLFGSGGSSLPNPVDGAIANARGVAGGPGVVTCFADRGGLTCANGPGGAAPAADCAPATELAGAQNAWWKCGSRPPNTVMCDQSNQGCMYITPGQPLPDDVDGNGRKLGGRPN